MDHRMLCLLAIALVVSSFSSAHGQDELADDLCTVEPHERINCGEPGITPTQCVDKGCCFDDSVAGAPWCYHPKQKEECEL